MYLCDILNPRGKLFFTYRRCDASVIRPQVKRQRRQERAHQHLRCTHHPSAVSAQSYQLHKSTFAQISKKLNMYTHKQSRRYQGGRILTEVTYFVLIVASQVSGSTCWQLCKHLFLFQAWLKMFNRHFEDIKIGIVSLKMKDLLELLVYFRLVPLY